MKITVIGAGNMGGALIKGWAKAQQDITATARTAETLEKIVQSHPSVKTSTDNHEAVKDADVVVLAVKPWLIEQVIKTILPSLDLEKQAIVSVAANVPTAQIREWLGCKTATVVYAMPNIAAEFGQSMTFIAPAEGIAVEKTNEIANLFALVGKVKVCEERLVAPGMMIAGCGIAYIMRFLRAMMEGGVEMGIYPKDALQFALQAMQGTVTLLEETGLHPEAAIDKVTTPGGVTIKGLNELDHAGFSSAVVRSLKAGLK